MTTNDQNALAGYFTDRAGADRAVRDLISAGFNENDIDLAPYNDAATGQYAGTAPYLESSSYLNSDTAYDALRPHGRRPCHRLRHPRPGGPRHSGARRGRHQRPRQPWPRQ